MKKPKIFNFVQIRSARTLFYLFFNSKQLLFYKVFWFDGPFKRKWQFKRANWSPIKWKLTTEKSSLRKMSIPHLIPIKMGMLWVSIKMANNCLQDGWFGFGMFHRYFWSNKHLVTSISNFTPSTTTNGMRATFCSEMTSAWGHC